MKAAIFPLMAFLPLLVVIILAIAGITLNFWVYIILAVICPLAVGIIWFIYKETEKKIKEAGKGRL